MDIQIPYEVEARKDTGLYNAKMGIWLFLASEVMLFGGLFASYVMLRVGAASWPNAYEIQNIPLGTINTVLLNFSCMTMILAWLHLRSKNFAQHQKFLTITIILGVIFLLVKMVEYKIKFSHGFFPKTNTYLAIYFTMTFLHALHIVGGLIVLSYFRWPGAKMWQKDPTHFLNRIEVAGLYWHFVDLVWIFLFPVLYLLPGK